ncbi:MAG: hypothetical protein LBC92_00130 [Rickettsiales bacterium]|jgi:hypothetical protein|nr:hypothetical protein [Rickettsiales bacterium]
MQISMTDIQQINESLKKIQRDLYNIQKKMTRERVERFLVNKISDKGLQKQIIKEFIRMVQIEIHNYCNRQCWWCGNKYNKNRNKKLEEMPEKMFLNVLSNLKEIDYSASVCLTKYNEAFVDKELLYKRAKQCKEYLPNCSVRCVTNGDNIKKNEDLLNAYNSGIDLISYSLYFTDKEYDDYGEDIIVKKLESVFQKLDLKFNKNELKKGSDTYYSLQTYPFKDKCLYITILNFKKSASTMGHLIKESPWYNRFQLTQPCDMPFSLMSFEYDGTCATCCNVRGDMIDHYCFQLGNLKYNNIFELFFNKKAIKNRKKLLYYGNKEYPCNDCWFNCNAYNQILKDAIFDY